MGQEWSNTYYQKLYGYEIENPPLEISALSILLKSGADINRRPYVWHKVYWEDNKAIDSLVRQRGVDGRSMAPADVKEEVESYVSDVNRLLEAYLKAGADPDKRGDPFPYDWDKTNHGRITDEEANKHFQNGSRAINVAIEKGIAWESQVDLLLQYTKLDEESLKAAERSGDPKMIEKINKLWNEQQKPPKETPKAKKKSKN